MVRCGDACCTQVLSSEAEIDLHGWRVVAGTPYCALHYYGPYREAKKEAVREQILAQRRRHDSEVARKYMSAAEYRAWDQFQADMADYHKKTGKLAPDILRTLRPMNWLQEFKEKGRIDIEATAANFEQAKIARGKRTIDRLKGI